VRNVIKKCVTKNATDSVILSNDSTRLYNQDEYSGITTDSSLQVRSMVEVYFKGVN
jgi:hypothetical protein